MPTTFAYGDICNWQTKVFIDLPHAPRIGPVAFGYTSFGWSVYSEAPANLDWVREVHGN